ncbi:AraC family transcriptional regulator [Nocardia sp. 348MFTsu5.1]|uniref:AraC family transcriptional regulator n=1 Tax=Nocardia sp. 348MFTsu5.1 TaxID=1172185 RepID=UPI000382D1D2|nr:AraC family transcriptional regulator [Nocardia sp. 348MFTsu5.1]
MPERVERSGLTDWDEVHEVVADAYFPHELRPISRDDATRYRLKSSPVGPAVLARIGFGAAVSIESDHPGAWGINIPLTGHLESTTEGHHIISTPGQATVCPPDTRTVITDWSRSCEIIGFKIDRDYLQREVDRICGRPGRHLPHQLDLRSGAGAEWMTLLNSVGDQAFGESVLLRNEHMAQQVCGMLTTALVLAAIPADENDPVGTRPRIVKRVIDAIHADPARPWTAGELAEIGGVSARRLQQGFREYVGLTPMEYLLDVRLECVHNDLLHGVAGTNITYIANGWGIMHSGRFAAAYRRKYGVPPSDTRRLAEA